MLTLVTFVPSARRSPQAASLLADYAVFERRRAARRPFLTMLLGLAVVILLGGVVGSLPTGQAEGAIGVCLAPAALLAVSEWIDRHRMLHRLDRARADVRSPRKS